MADNRIDQMEITQHQSLKAFNTFGIEATARFFLNTTSIEELVRFVTDPKFDSFPILVLGGGSNILFTDDYPGIVIRMDIPGIQIIREDNRFVWIQAGSGTVWHDLVTFAVNRNFGGIENLSLIPGRTGATPIQNIGAYGVELKDVFESLDAISLETGEIRTFSASECEFGYRNSIFKNDLKGQYAITNVVLKLDKKPRLNTDYKGIKETLEEMGISPNNVTVKDISNAVIRLRTRKLPDPGKLGNAGSFFKNPEIEKERFEDLRTKYPKIPGYNVADNVIKVPAAWMIQQCGWKGKIIGHVGTYENQPLVLVNHGGATGNEILSLSNQIRESVVEKFGIELEREVNVV